MKISINESCFNRSINIIDNSERIFDFPNNIKRKIITKMIAKITDEVNLDQLIQDISLYLTPSLSEYDDCGQCGNNNSYEEYEI